MLGSQEYPYLLSKRGVDRLVNAECLGNRAGNKLCVTNRCQCYKGDAIDKIWSDILDKLKCESRLTDTGRSGQSEQARAAAAKQFKRVGTFSLSPNQSGWRNRKIKRVRTWRCVRKGIRRARSGQQQGQLLAREGNRSGQ